MASPEAASNNSMASPSTPAPLVNVRDEKVLERLTWIKFPQSNRQNNNNDNKHLKDLYWPALKYRSHQEAADFANHQNFQHLLAEPLLEMLMAEEDAADPGPVCRLLGFKDGTFVTLESFEAFETETHDFVKNMARLYVNKARREKYFDMSLPLEEELWNDYQAGFLEAKALVKEVNLNKRRSSNIGSTSAGDAVNTNKRLKPAASNDKPDAASHVSFQVVPPAAVAPSAAQQREVVQLAVAATTAGPTTPKKNSKKNQKKPPATPPFLEKSEILNVAPNEDWKTVWFQMRCTGWIKRTAPNGVVGDEKGFIWLKPGRSPTSGVPGTDFFTSERDCQAYVHSKIGHWQNPGWGEDNLPPVAAQAAVPARRGGGAMSSSATVITTDSAPSPVSQRAPRAARRAAAQAGASMYKAQSILVNYKLKERLWWRNTGLKSKDTSQKVPTLSAVKPILHKLGIRRNEVGSYVLPDPVIVDKEYPTPPDLVNAHELRKYLCTKGVPSVVSSRGSSSRDLISSQEQAILHRWVSFAYVSIDDLGKKLKETTLPSENQIYELLAKFKFETCNGRHFVPNVDESGARGTERREGLHYFQGLAKVRDYIRRAASFAWTKDDFDASDDDESDDWPEEKALLRLWAASSPSTLPTYETSTVNIQKMETMLPRKDNDFEADSEAEESTDEEEESEEEEGQEDESMAESAEASSEEESVVTEAEQSVQASRDPEEESVHSGSSGTETACLGSSQASPEPATLAAKRKAESSTKKCKRSAKKQKQLPWWQEESFPSIDTMKPILGKLGIFKQGSAFVLPGQASKAMRSIESVRKVLCSGGIPVHNTSKPNLNEDEKELLRRWVSFAHVPVTQKRCKEDLARILRKYEDTFSSASETRIGAVLGDAGFQRDFNGGGGYFPPGIDSVGRDSSVRKAHLKKDMSEIREYIRCSEKLTLVDKDGGVTHDDELKIDSDKLLALRLWGALEESTLRSYAVDPSCVIAIAPEEGSPPAKGSKKKTKCEGQAPGPLECPLWWSESSLEQLQDKIDELKAKDKEVNSKRSGARSKRRGAQAHMSSDQLEVAAAIRMRVESIVRSSLTKKEPDTIEDLVIGIGEDCDIKEFSLQKFLCGDEKALKSQVVHAETAAKLQGWLDEQEGVARPETSEVVAPSVEGKAATVYSTPEPPKAHTASAAEADSLADSTFKYTTPTEDDAKEGGGSLVLNLQDPSQPKQDLSTTNYSSPLAKASSTAKVPDHGNADEEASSDRSKRVVSDVTDPSQSNEVQSFHGSSAVSEDSAMKDAPVEMTTTEEICDSTTNDKAVTNGNVETKEAVQPDDQGTTEAPESPVIDFNPKGKAENVQDGPNEDSAVEVASISLAVEGSENPSMKIEPIMSGSWTTGQEVNHLDDMDTDDEHAGAFLTQVPVQEEEVKAADTLDETKPEILQLPNGFSPVQSRPGSSTSSRKDDSSTPLSAKAAEARRVTSDVFADLPFATQPEDDTYRNGPNDGYEYDHDFM